MLEKYRIEIKSIKTEVYSKEDVINQINKIYNDKKNLQNDIDNIEILIIKQRNENKEYQEKVPQLSQLRRDFEHSPFQNNTLVKYHLSVY